ncbi:hypothetical protein [Brevundimonas sp.]
MPTLTTLCAPGPSARSGWRWSANLLAGFLFIGTLLVSGVSAAQAPTPEILFYQFDETGTAVTNRASSPPPGAASATLMGGLTQGGSISGTFLSAVVGSGVDSSTDYVNTGWATNLPGSFTISFFSSEIAPSGTLFYVMGDPTASSLRIFTNGVAGANNWILRGPVTDITIPGAR